MGSKKGSERLDMTQKITVQLIVLFSVVLIGLLILYTILDESPSKRLGEGLASIGVFGIDTETGVYFPEDCTPQNLWTLWDSVFVETSSGTTILTDTNCTGYFLHKSVGNISHLLGGSIGNESIISAVYGNFSDIQPTISSITESTIVDQTFFIILSSFISGSGVQGNRFISSVSNAQTEFSNIFSLSDGNWSFLPENGGVLASYRFTDKGNGTVFTNKTLNMFSHSINSSGGVLLKRTQNFSNLTVAGGQYVADIIDFDDYFACSGNLSYTVQLISSFCPSNFSVSVDSGNRLDVNQTGDCFNEQKIGVNAFCTPNQSLAYLSDDDLTFYIFIDNSSVNNTAPDFLPNKCDNIFWKRNTNYTLDMVLCFEDGDGDSLVYRYTNRSNENVSIFRSGNVLTLVPDTNWIGGGNFYVYGDDSFVETRGRVDFNVVINLPSGSSSGGSSSSSGSSSGGLSRNNSGRSPNTNIIQNPQPSGLTVALFEGREQNFSVSNLNYDQVAWYLDNEIVERNSTSVTLQGLETGEYTLRVSLVYQGIMHERTWQIKVIADVDKGSSLELKTVVYFLIIGILVILILLVMRLLFKRLQSFGSQPVSGFGIVGSMSGQKLRA